MVKQGVLVKIEHSEWANPIAVVRKIDKDLRICINPKNTLNPALTEDHYPITGVDDMITEIGAHKFYSVLDLTGAFQQLELSAK